jgi:hypothetical protein
MLTVHELMLVLCWVKLAEVRKYEMQRSGVPFPFRKGRGAVSGSADRPTGNSNRLLRPGKRAIVSCFTLQTNWKLKSATSARKTGNCIVLHIAQDKKGPLSQQFKKAMKRTEQRWADWPPFHKPKPSLLCSSSRHATDKDEEQIVLNFLPFQVFRTIFLCSIDIFVATCRQVCRHLIPIQT